MKPVTLSIHKFLHRKIIRAILHKAHINLQLKQKYIIFLFIIVFVIQYYLAKRLHLCSGLYLDILDYSALFAASRPLLFCRPVPSNLPYAISSVFIFSAWQNLLPQLLFFPYCSKRFFIVHLNSIHSAVGLIFRSHTAKMHPVQGLIEYLFFPSLN